MTNVVPATRAGGLSGVFIAVGTSLAVGWVWLVSRGQPLPSSRGRGWPRETRVWLRETTQFPGRAKKKKKKKKKKKTFVDPEFEFYT